MEHSSTYTENASTTEKQKKIGKSYIYWNRHRGIKDFL